MVRISLSCAAILVITCVSGLILFRRERGFASLLLPVVLLLCAILETVDSLAVYYPSNFLIWKKIAIVIEAVIPQLFLLLSVTFGRRISWQGIPRISKLLLILSPTLPVIALSFSPDKLFYSPDFISEQILFLSTVGMLFYIAVFIYIVAALANLESTFRSAGRPEQWQIKFTIMGVGSLLALFAFYYSHGLLYRSINMNLIPLRSLAMLVGGGLLVYSFLRRDRGVRVVVSKEMAFRSVVFIIIGGYLIALGLIGQGLRYFGDSSQQIIFLALFFISAVFLTAVLLSEEIKRKIKVFINKNFFENKYDYRLQWLEFTNRLAAAKTTDELEKAILSKFCEAFAMGGAMLYLWTPEQGIFYNKNCYQEKHSGITIKRDNPLIKYMEKRQWVFNVDYVEPDILDAIRYFVTETQMSFAIPIFFGNELEGFISLIRPINAGEEYTYEDYDLMKTFAGQASVALANAWLSEKLAEVREMEAIGKVTAFVMHDLKNLVYSLSLLSANANEFICDPEFQKDLLEGLSNNVVKMKALIDKLKDVPERHELNLLQVNLLDLVKEAVASVNSNGITVTGKAIETCVDPHELAKVVVNLVINALDATEGKGQVSVEVGGYESIFIKVVDNGCGMTPEFIFEELFAPFKTTKKMGLGIGLYQCRQIVEAHRGRIEVESELGKGTTFTVWLPHQIMDI